MGLGLLRFVFVVILMAGSIPRKSGKKRSDAHIYGYGALYCMAHACMHI